MQQNTKQYEQTAKITRAGMEEELGESYKRCWAIAFKLADEGLEMDDQIEQLSCEFDLIRPQAEWFINGVHSILRRKEKQPQTLPKPKSQPVQQSLAQFSDISAKVTRQTERYVSQLELMSFLQDVEEMSQNADFVEFWEDLKAIKDNVTEQQCATEKEVLRVFKIRSMVQRKREETERFFDAYPVSTDAWENGHFDANGEIIY
jgi:hypothetical protein